MRKNGVPLERMTHRSPPDFDKLKRLHSDLTKQRTKEEKELFDEMREAVATLDPPHRKYGER